MGNKKPLKTLVEYNCIDCNFITKHKRDYNSHLLTAKHNRVILGNIKTPKPLVCNCGKEYKNRHTLSRHTKNCNFQVKQSTIENPLIDTTFVIDLIKKNQELQDLLLEQSKQNSLLVNKLVQREPVTINNSNNNNNTTNNNNQKFNLNFFLNETCKDAMNIQEFIENIKITFQDLLTIGNSGFVDGVSDIFIKQLRDLDVTKRPIHCTDVKRETIFLKEEDAWNKDDKENTKLKNVIEKVEYKNVAALQSWCIENPDSKINNTDNNLLRDKIYMETLQGDEKTRDKIIKNISKETIIEKD
jgi:hypothetical protein